MQGHNASSMSRGSLESLGSMYSELEHVFMSGTLMIIMIAALVGNIMVCIIICRKRRLRTRTNAFIVNLACADLGVVTMCMPFSLVTCLFHNWILGDVTCKLNGFFNIVFTQSSLLTLIAIGVDKYYAIVWPLRRLMTKRRTMGLLGWTWLQPVAIAVVPFMGVVKFEFKEGTTQCGLEIPRNIPQIIYGVSVTIFGYFIPLGIMGYAYIKIFHSAKRSARRMSRISLTSTTSTHSVTSHKKVAVTVLILVFVFLICWTPYFAYAIIVTVNHNLSSNQHVLGLGKASYWMAFLCSALNPYIYGARNPQFRKEFKMFFCFFFPCIFSRLKTRRCTITGSKGSSEGSYGQNGYNPLHRGSVPWNSPCSTPFMSPKGRYSEEIKVFLQMQRIANNDQNNSISENENEESICNRNSKDQAEGGTQHVHVLEQLSFSEIQSLLNRGHVTKDEGEIPQSERSASEISTSIRTDRSVSVLKSDSQSPVVL